MSSAAEASPAGSGQLAGKEVLVIGGTQFMGRHVVSSLLSHGAHVTILNRGKTPNPFKGDACVTHLRCDRLNEGKRFRALLAAGPGPVAGHTQCGAGKEGGGMTGAWSGWDAVIDFVCFRKKGMEDILSQAHAIGHYVFISSDSVFMACDRAQVLARQSAEGLAEEAAIAPTTKEAKKNAKRNNPYQFEYGGGKLDCELCLEASGGGGAAPRLAWRAWTILRLPDVIGPWDNIGSQLRLHRDLLGGKKIGTKTGSSRISLVDATDVARAIIAVLCGAETVHGHTLHLACSEKPTFEEYVRMVAGALGVEADIDAGEEAEMVTVDMGPISNAKALALLDWKPKPLDRTVRDVVEWYTDSDNRRYTQVLGESSSSSDSDSSGEEAPPERQIQSAEGAGATAVWTPSAGDATFRFNFE